VAGDRNRRKIYAKHFHHLKIETSIPEQILRFVSLKRKRKKKKEKRNKNKNSRTEEFPQ
jgi:ribosomal protein S6